MAAGLGFKTFTTGEVLTAGDVNGYLMQGVLVFASTAARDAAITSPQEGQFAFTKDTNGLWYYDGAVWVASGATGDIEGVTAGIGISGGGTSGTVTVTNSMATAIDAKGDLVAGTGADTFSKLTVGANDTVLTADSAQATGLKWATPASGGMTLISTTSLTGSITNITSIPGTYKSLLLRVLGAYGTNTSTLQFRFNNNSTNPAYASSTNAYTSSYSISGLGGTWMYGGNCYNSSVGDANIVELYIPNYASSTQKKYCVSYSATRADASSAISLGLQQNYWDNAAAITQINVGGFSSFSAGSALLYGIN